MKLTADPDRARGVLLGLTAGDRNGGPAAMALRLALSLIGRRCFDAQDVLARYMDWWRAEGFDTGPIAEHVFKAISSGVAPEAAVARAHAILGQTGGCNPAHRVGPVAVALFLGGGEIAEIAQREARLTHHDPIAGDVAAAVVVLCRELIVGRDWGHALQAASVGRTPPTQEAIGRQDRNALSRGGYAPEVLRSAIYFVGQSTDFRGALDSSIRFAGPANYAPVLVGAIGGARWGASAIRPEDLSHCSNLSVVEQAATDLCELRDRVK